MGRLMGLLALLNAMLLIVGLGMEQVRGQPSALVDFNADKVRLLGWAEQAQAPPVVEVAGAGEAAAEPEAVAEAVAPRPRCLAWSRLDEGLLGEIEARLRGAGIPAARYDIHLQKRLGWWVYLAPFADAEAMQAGIDAARQKGVKDLAPVRGGEMENAVSLGTFPTLAKARVQLEQLRALGVPGVRMGPRPKSGSARLVVADNVAEAKLAGLDEGWGKGHAPTVCAGH